MSGRSGPWFVLATLLVLSACGAAPVASRATHTEGTTASEAAPGEAAPSETAPSETASSEATTLVLAADVSWEQLNPARGAASPMAANLWGDRNGTGPAGFLVRFVDGFSSPPHIHNVTYRGVVISGLVHNDDAAADPRWMPTGSFWTQPRGAPHITAARGDTIAYIEIDDAPYLVRPVSDSFESGETPVNVDASDIAWTSASSVGWLAPPSAAEAAAPRVAFLWGDALDEAPSGTLVELPAGFSGQLRGRGATLRAVVIHGRVEHESPSRPGRARLEAGSHFGSRGQTAHVLSSEPGSLLYVRAEGRFELVAAP